MGIKPQQLEEPEPTLEDEFQDFILLTDSRSPTQRSIYKHYNWINKYEKHITEANNGSAFQNIGLLEETGHIFELADGTKSYPIGIVKDIEVHIGKLKLLNDFYVIDMKKDPKTPLLVRRGFLATANVVIDYSMAKIAVGEGITRSVFRVKGVDLGEEEAPYWTTLGKRESYKPRPSSNGVGARTPYYARK
ncbi:MAK10-like protein [Tanacetum coccineum]|uniref:MAK10-like protein n=1 Tax=Tanacetum coccineum TaxID=301880 RepID=A0ABQ5GNM3_9ASTR